MNYKKSSKKLTKRIIINQNPKFTNFRQCPLCGGEIWVDTPYINFDSDKAEIIFECRGHNRKKDSCDFSSIATLRPGDFVIKE